MDCCFCIVRSAVQLSPLVSVPKGILSQWKKLADNTSFQLLCQLYCSMKTTFHGWENPVSVKYLDSVTLLWKINITSSLKNKNWTVKFGFEDRYVGRLFQINCYLKIGTMYFWIYVYAKIVVILEGTFPVCQYHQV